MGTALNPNKTDFSMSPGLSTRVVYVFGLYGPVIPGGVVHQLALLVCRGAEGTVLQL